MSGTWKAVPVRPVPEQVQLIATTCDRCGSPSTILGAHDRRAWGQVEVVIQGVGPYFADLCAGCASALRSWIDLGGDGGGMVDAGTRASEPAHATTVGSKP